MQIVLRGIAVLMIAVGVALCLLWIVGPTIEAVLRGPNHSGLSLGFTLQNTTGVLSLGLCLALPGILLLLGTNWLSVRWMPLKSVAQCRKCGFPRDDMTREKCPDCGEGLFTPGANRERVVQRVTGETVL
jgi:hypothetical protein